MPKALKRLIMGPREIERMIRISRERPLDPATCIPWDQAPQPGEYFLPEQLISLEGLPCFQYLSPVQKLELGRHEIVQVLYSYKWGEGLFCLFLERYLRRLPPDNLECQFLRREIIEETRHQEMFATAIQKLGGTPLPISHSHRLIATINSKLLPADCLFMGSLAIEMVADHYGNHSRKDPALYPVLRKVFQLHHIEEARHIIFTRSLLGRYISRAGVARRTVYSLIVLLNVYFLRTLYVKKEIYDRIGMPDPAATYTAAAKHYKTKFTSSCLGEIVSFVDSWGGFNSATRWAWRLLMNASV